MNPEEQGQRNHPLHLGYADFGGVYGQHLPLAHGRDCVAGILATRGA